MLCSEGEKPTMPTSVELGRGVSEGQFDSPDLLSRLSLSTLASFMAKAKPGQVPLASPLPPPFGDQLLQTLSDNKQLRDENLQAFDPSLIALQAVQVDCRANSITENGLRVLKKHRVRELRLTHLRSTSVCELVRCLSDWSVANLRVLDVTGGTFLGTSSRYCVVIALSWLRGLRELSVANTEFNNSALELVAQDLPSLEILNLSNTPVSDFSPLRRMKGLQGLGLYNTRPSDVSAGLQVLVELTDLRFLDISGDHVQPVLLSGDPVPGLVRADHLLQRTHCWPFLQGLDLSGHSFDFSNLQTFLSSHSTQLRFLGLCMNDANQELSMCSLHSPYIEAGLEVSGEATVRQLQSSLLHYAQRPLFMQSVLRNLFLQTQGPASECLNTAVVLSSILPVMEYHTSQLGVQMAGTACLYNLTRGDLSYTLHSVILTKVVHTTLSAMDAFPMHKQLQKNTLLTLCSDRILQEVNFDRFRCARLVLESLCNYSDPTMNRMAVAICTILAAKIPTEQTSILGTNARYMHKLLQLVQRKAEDRQVDITMKFALSALWNLTDESPASCRAFLRDAGLQLFMDTLKSFVELEYSLRVQVETKMLGLLNNVAEVDELKPHIMKDEYVQQFRLLLQSSKIDVSYFAGGIFAHLCTVDESVWPLTVTRAVLLKELEEAVLRWEKPTGEMVAYRSFQPFLPLLRRDDLHAVQLWACWAIQHVCDSNMSSRYCPMLEREGGVPAVQRLCLYSPNFDVKYIACKIIHLVRNDMPRLLKAQEEKQREKEREWKEQREREREVEKQSKDEKEKEKGKEGEQKKEEEGSAKDK